MGKKIEINTVEKVAPIVDVEATSVETAKPKKAVKNKPNFGKVLEKNKAIMKYFYDEFGFRRGIIVALKGKDRDTPRVGFALFDELVLDGDCKVAVHTYLHEIPYFAKFVGYRSEAELPKESGIIEIIPTNKQKMTLLKRAMSRANTAREEYFNTFDEIPYAYYDFFNGDDEEINFRFFDKIICDEYREANEEDKSIGIYKFFSKLRRDLRDMEYRAWRYYK